MSIDEILKYSNPNEIVIMCGDMNFCYREKKHPWIQGFICHGFMQLGKQPTHICGGHIDLFHILASGQ